MKVIIFCGGKGTRLREETEFKPKPMVEIGNRPIMWYIMQRYAHFGFNNFILPLGYKGHLIKDYFYNYKTHNSDFTLDLKSGEMITHHSDTLVDWKVTLCDTGEDTEKGGRIKRVAKHLNNEPFMATYGDGLADINIANLIAFHKKQGKLVTFTGVRMPSRFGTVSTDENGNIASWQEKPILNEYTNCGYFVFQPEVLNYLTEDELCDLEKEPMQQIAKEGQLAMYPHKGFWQCMDTLRDYHLLTEIWEKNNAPWLV